MTSQKYMNGLRFNSLFLMTNRGIPIVLVIMMMSATPAMGQNVVELSKDVQVEHISGKSVSFSELIEKDEGIAIVSFWATWCKPCIQELDYLNDMYDELNTDMNVTVYAISIDDARSSKRVLPFVNGKSWEFEILLDENSVLKRSLNVLNVPHTFIIDRDKKIVYQHTSYVPGDEEEYFKIIEGLN